MNGTSKILKTKRYIIAYPVIILILTTLLYNCNRNFEHSAISIEHKPTIEPDYTDVTIPPNIAPMNFIIREEGNNFKVIAESEANNYQLTVNSKDGKICFPIKSWKKLLKNCTGSKILFKVYSSDNRKKILNEYEPFFMYVAPETVDPYLAYRLIYPGYYSWSELKIAQRCIENFSEKIITANTNLDMNCINCHSFSHNDAGKFLIHVRGSKGGTYFVSNGNITRHELKTDAMPGNATYPAWHPSGKYVAFSANQVRQVFYGHPSKCIEVFDLVSDLILYDCNKNETILIREPDSVKYLKTFPSWSADGKWLYYCRAIQYLDEPWRDPEKMEQIKYNIVRIPFNPDTRTFGLSELVYDAAGKGKSASFPRISPDNKYMIITLTNFGTFPLWHREADLYLININTGESKKMDINSDEAESYHEWSSNGRWLIFGSRRLDGRSTRPFYAYFNNDGKTGKPFVLPQKKPDRYNYMLESFNIPEPINKQIKIKPNDFERALKLDIIKAKPVSIADTLPEWEKKRANIITNTGDRPVH